MKRNVLFYILLLFAPLSLSAYHIIGGEITYQCLGNDEYRFTMKIYRDCSDPRGDQFDARAPVTIYRGNLDPYDQVQHIYASLRPNIRTLPVDNGNPCLEVPPGLCVQEGIYIFTATLPAINESYHIVYQRCCRNASIDNIQRPDDIGATFTVELTPDAQGACNSSPVFNNFPPIVICNNEPLVFDHSAFDMDGDQIVYEFCTPLQGGGTRGFRGGGSATACDGFRPDPACPPPFPGVSFIAPPYTAQQPMGGNPVIQIDANTGVITGRPLLQGQFVVGVCATEYRNGKAISSIRRDFQFNVANCEPTVVARMDADEVIGFDSFLISSCGENQVFIENTSYQQSAIDDYVWNFDVNGQTLSNSSWSPTIDFPGPGSYPGQLLLNPNSNCGDTAFVTVQIFPELVADFDFEYDTCIAGPVQFTDLSSVDNTEVVAWQWQFGDQSNGNTKNPSHLYLQPGNIRVQLEVTDENECVDVVSRNVSYFPVPNLIIISPSDFIGCNPGTIFFDNLSFPIDETYDINWDFGDGSFSDRISPTHTFRQEGVFDVSVEITSPIGCLTDTLFEKLIEIQASPIADFSYSPGNLSRFNNTVSFTDQSVNAIFREWLFDGTNRSTELNPVVTFRDTGVHEVRLVVRHEQGCKDTAYAYLDVIPDVTFFMPTAFSPNDDGENDVFKGVGVLEGIKEYQLRIWNRWGEMVYESTEPNAGWNGRKYNDGAPAPPGVYVVMVRYREPRGEIVEAQSTVMLIR
jgi:gliding motility-associated-like protein